MSNFFVKWCLVCVMFNILQWNAQSVRAHGDEFKKYVEENKPDVVCIQETWLKSTQVFRIPGYDILRKDRNIDGRDSGRGGCCIFVRKGLAVSNVAVKSEKLETQLIEIWTANMTKIYVANIYNPSYSWDTDWLDNIMSKSDSLIFICGDFNAHSTMWGGEKSDKNGKVIEEIIEGFNLVCLNNGDGTRLDPVSGKLSAIDITLCSSNIAAKCSWEVYSDKWGSDHFPICISYGAQVYHSKNNGSSRWSMKNPDWSKFHQSCHKYICYPDDSGDVDSIYNDFIDQVSSAADETFPKVKLVYGNKSCVPWWNEECKIAVANRKRALNKLKRNNTPANLAFYKDQKAVTRKTIFQAKKKNWEAFTSGINSQTATSKVWKSIHRINRTKVKSSMPVLKNNNQTAVTDLDKANMLATSFAHVSSTDNYKDDFKERKAKAEKDFLVQEPDGFVLDEPFSLDEFEAAVNKAKCTTPGKDGINMKMIQNFPLHVKNVLLYIFNIFWIRSSCPDAWKQAVLTPLPKPGKDHSHPLSYRPIALTSVVGKVMERMVNNRLLWFLEANNMLNQVQSGFRKTRRTTDHLVNLENSINKGFANKESTVAVFLDIQKAYDMVWRKGVLIKLQLLGVGGKVVKWVDSFLTNRSIQVRVNGVLSSRYGVENGVPQGSVISPLLFNIAVSDIPSQVTESGVKISQFADDIALWKTHKNILFAGKKVHQGLTAIVDWCGNWGFQLSPQKTVGVLFTQKKSTPKLEIKIDGKDVQFKKEARFLGLIFDDKLSWKKHLDYVQDRCKKRLNLLRCISGSTWGADGPLLLRLYKALIVPVIDYGCEAYDSTTDSLKKLLDSIQYKALKICTGAIKGTSLKSLQVECGVPPLHLRRKFLTDCYGISIQANPVHPNRCMFDDNWQKHYLFDGGNDRLFHRPFEVRVAKLDHDPMDSSYSHRPRWDYEEVETSVRLFDLIKGSDDGRVKREIVVKEINSHWATSLHIYTDGSLDPESTKVGCSFVVPPFKLSHCFRLSNGISIFSAELMAILLALEWVDEVKPRDVTIFSDCKSAVSKISNFDHDNKIVHDIQMLYKSLHAQGLKVEVVWIPGHVGIYGNDWADLAAKKALEKNKVDIRVKLNRNECKSILKKQLKKEWQGEWTAYNSSNMLKVVRPDVQRYMINWKVCRKWEIQFHRLRLGKYWHLKSYLYSINKHPDGKCETCCIEDTSKHFILECKKYESQRKLLVEDLESIGFNKEFTIVNLLGGKTPPIDSIMTFVERCRKH